MGRTGCKSPLGMADSKIKDSQITVSSVLRGAYGRQARLHQNIPNWGAWCPVVSGGSITFRNYDQYIQIDLLNVTKITGIATQGREYNGGREKVKDYELSYKKDGGVWHFYRRKDQAAKIFLGNTHASTVVQHDLDPTIMARYFRVHPGYDTGTNTCMRLELYGCVPEQVILSYSMPVGHTTINGKVKYEDMTYNGVIANGFYKDGTGILTDVKFGPADVKEGKGWVGWKATLTQSQYIDIIFEFSGVRKFANVTLTVNVAKKHNAVFNRSQIIFSSTKDGFSSDTSFLQYCPRDFQAKDDSYNANVTLSLCENTARFMKLRLYFAGQWLLISEISFNSVPVSKDEKKSLQSCSGKTSYSCLAIPTTRLPTTIPQTNTKPKPGYDSRTSIGTTNPIVMFVVGAAVTLAIVLVVIFAIQIYKRRRHASKLSSSVLAVDTIEMQNETAPEASQNNQESHYSPADDGTEPYEEVQISPPSVYAELDSNRQDESTNDGTYQKLLKRDSDYVIPAHTEAESSYEEVGKRKSPPGYTELDNTKRVQDDSADYQKLIKK